MRQKTFFRITILSLALALLVSCAMVPITGRRQISLVSMDELTSMSFSQYTELMKKSKISTDKTSTTMVRRVGTRIAASAEQFLRDNGLESEISNYQWEFNVIADTATVNAFCMPGGKVAVYTGILPVTKTETGLAVVIGHEVAHALANHGGERLSQSLLQQLGGQTLAIALQNNSEATKNLALQAYGIGTELGVMLPYSRLHESEADHIGLILMARAGYDPREAIPFWQRMSQVGGAKPPEILSSHPADETRINSIRELLPEALKYYQPSK